MNRDTLRARIEALGPWFHNMEIDGVWTAPDHFLGDYPQVKWKNIAPAIPADLSGRSVLDIGCNGGFYALEMKRRGAARVLGIDEDPFYLAQARFAAEATGLDVEFRQLSVYDVGALGERFDIVIFMGVLYHLRHPLLALDLIRAHAASDLMLFQSMLRGDPRTAPIPDDVDFWDLDIVDEPTWPKLHFVERRMSGDPTNWWIPNRACAEGMLRASGFEIIGRPEEEVMLCRCADLPEGAAVYPVAAS